MFIAFVVRNEEGGETFTCVPYDEQKILLQEKSIYIKISVAQKVHILKNRFPLKEQKRDHIEFKKRGV